jgi:uncharacterized protein (DUF433 family)
MTPLVETVVIDWTDCPFVEINPRKVSGTPILKGTRMPADGIVENYRNGSPVEEIADNFEIPEEGVRDLLLYASKQNSAIKI